MTGKIQRLKISNFTAFNNAEFKFCSGVNVLIGANSTGKTHVLKSIYTLLKINQAVNLRNSRGFNNDEIATDKVTGVFKIDSLSTLMRNKGESPDLATLQIYYYDDIPNGQEQTLSINSNDRLTYTPRQYMLPPTGSVLFLPSQEFLSLYEGFISAYTQRETAFDETYYDLAIALNAAPLRHIETVELLLKPLKKIISERITLEGGKFYITLPEGKLESHLVSEGYRKLAMLMYLIRNGSITPKGVLLWDEPETNLNPNLVTVIVDTLLALAKAGLQIFIATHDYLLSQELSLRAEYNDDVPMNFFALYKDNINPGVQVETANTLVGIDNNPIIREFAAHYDREMRVFNNTSNPEN